MGELDSEVLLVANRSKYGSSFARDARPKSLYNRLYALMRFLPEEQVDSFHSLYKGLCTQRVPEFMVNHGKDGNTDLHPVKPQTVRGLLSLAVRLGLVWEEDGMGISLTDLAEGMMINLSTY